MSNHLAPATVTAALKQLLQDALDADVPGAKAQVGRPEASGDDATPLVNIFLYQATPNAAARNSHMPARRGDGRMSGPSAVALDLHYLISFIGTASGYGPELLLGTVARALEHKPVITRAAIEKAIDENPGVLDATDLHRASETVRIHQGSLTLDDLSKLWSVLFQVPYVLSVAYTCSPVLIETAQSGSGGPPVTRVTVGTLLMGGPVLEGVEAQAGAAAPITWGGGIAIKGRGLDRSGLALRIGGLDADLTAATITATRIELPLTAAIFGAYELKAGPVLVEAMLPPPPGMGPHMARVTGRATFLLRPRLAANAVTTTPPAGPNGPVDGSLTIGFSPAIRKGQQARLMLDGQALAVVGSYQLAHAPVADADYPAAELTFPFTGVRQDSYHLQAVVDGVTSAPEIDLDPQSPTFREITGPTVAIP